MATMAGVRRGEESLEVAIYSEFRNDQCSPRSPWVSHPSNSHPLNTPSHITPVLLSLSYCSADPGHSDRFLFLFLFCRSSVSSARRRRKKGVSETGVDTTRWQLTVHEGGLISSFNTGTRQSGWEMEARCFFWWEWGMRNKKSLMRS